MLESLTEWMSYPLYYAMDNQTPPPRAGAAHATIFPYGPFEANDGSQVMFGLQNSREWDSFCRMVLQRDDLADNASYTDNSGRQAARSTLEPIIRGILRELPANEIRQRLDKANIANARVNTMHDVWQHPQLAARHRWRQVATPIGDVPALLPPGSWDDADPRMDAVPALGEHTDAILKTLGMDEETLTTLRQSSAIQ